MAQLTDPGPLGFAGSSALASNSWIAEFRDNVASWASTQEWLAADLIAYHVLVPQFQQSLPAPERKIWRPDSTFVTPHAFLAHSPSHLLMADKLLREGRLLNEMGWRDFEKLIAELLQTHGWDVTLMQGTKDGGIDVLAERNDPVLGALKAIWQAKRYASDRKVQLSHLRELSAVVEIERATKGIVVTTSALTRGAIEWIQRDKYRLEAKDGHDVEKWIKGRLYGQ